MLQSFVRLQNNQYICTSFSLYAFGIRSNNMQINNRQNMWWWRSGQTVVSSKFVHHTDD